jgi:pimeloyl-ACP methyl ester carboxylesterase
MRNSMSETVVLVPGIGFGGCELFFLARCLRQHGYVVKIFWKNPWRCSLSASADALYSMLMTRPIAKTHLVAHSLGGFVVLQLLRDYPHLSIARIVFLGVPLSGCLAAQRVSRIPGGRRLLGQALGSICWNPSSSFPTQVEVAAIAGKLNFLLGFLLCPHKQNDTLVCVEETYHSDLKSTCVLPVSHTSMLFSKQVINYVKRFIDRGTFV